MNTLHRQSWGEKGMVSFTITLIMMAVITMIVIGFSQVARRNARESLDRQLSSQAFYAAESGVNVTRSALTDFVNSKGITNLAAKTTCPNDYEPDATVSPTGEDTSNPNAGILSSANDIKYTCVLVDPTPHDLRFPATQSSSVIMPAKTDGAGLSNLTFQWRLRPDGVKRGCSPGTFPTPSAWGNDCDYGVLRVDLMQIPDASVTVSNSDQLASKTVTLFMSPRSGNPTGQTVSFGSSTTAYLLSSTNCAIECKVTVGLPGGVNFYTMRVTIMYQDSQLVTVTGNNGTARFVGSQAVIDVTGRAQDELRRIQERVALTPTADSVPLDAVASSTDICKHFSILPVVVSDPSDNVIDLDNTCQ